jgi:hypothetical protein
MNEHENTDDLLKKMGETHQRYEASHDENALLLRALEARPARPRWAVAGWLVAALIVVGLIIRPMLPALGGGPYSDYTINGVKVRAYHSDDKNFPGTFYSFSLEGKEFYIAQQPEKYPEEPLVAEVRLGDTGCVLYSADAPLAEPNLSETKKFQPSMDAVKSISVQVDKAKLWPADLWSIRPFIKKLARRDYRIEYTGPVSAGFVTAQLRHIGDRTGYWLQGFGMESIGGDTLDTVAVRLIVWPDRFALRAFANPELILSGDAHGYDAYQETELWGQGVRDSLFRIKQYLPKYQELLPLLGDGVLPMLTQSLRETSDQIITSEPRALYHADIDEMLREEEPWRPVDASNVYNKQDEQAQASLIKGFSFEWKGLKVSGPANRKYLTIERDGLKVSLSSHWGLWAEGSFTQKGERLATKVYLSDKGRLPRLSCKLRPENESLLEDASALAKDALAIPVKEWPSGGPPEELVENWLGALSDWQFAVRESLGHTMLMTLTEREGNSAGLIVSFGERASMGEETSMDINLRLGMDGFQLLNTATSYLVSTSGGKVSAIRTDDAAPSALTDEDVRQLETVIRILGATVAGIPSAVEPGVDKLREFLKHPETAKVEVVNELPKVLWAGMATLDRYSEISLGIQSLKDVPSTQGDNSQQAKEPD